MTSDAPLSKVLSPMCGDLVARHHPINSWSALHLDMRDVSFDESNLFLDSEKCCGAVRLLFGVHFLLTFVNFLQSWKLIV